MKRYLLAALFAIGLIGIARAVVIDGTDTSDQTRVVAIGYEQLSVTNGITAFAGGGNTSAVLLTSAYNRVTTVGTTADSVKLPPCVAGAVGNGLTNTIGVLVWVANQSGTSLTVYPSAGDTINALTVTTGGLPVAGNKSGVFVCGVAGFWNSLLSG